MQYKRFLKLRFRDFILKNYMHLDFRLISLHPLVDFYFVKTHPEFPWNCTIAKNPNITMDIVEKYPEFPWNYKLLSENPNITMDFILSNYYKEWCWSGISRTIKTVMSDVLNYPTLQWSWPAISSNPNITDEFAFGHLDKMPANCLAMNPSISMNFLKTTDAIFDYYICYNVNIKPEHIDMIEFPSFPILSAMIDIEYIFSHPRQH